MYFIFKRKQYQYVNVTVLGGSKIELKLVKFIINLEENLLNISITSSKIFFVCPTLIRLRNSDRTSNKVL